MRRGARDERPLPQVGEARTGSRSPSAYHNGAICVCIRERRRRVLRIGPLRRCGVQHGEQRVQRHVEIERYQGTGWRRDVRVAELR